MPDDPLSSLVEPIIVDSPIAEPLEANGASSASPLQPDPATIEKARADAVGGAKPYQNPSGLPPEDPQARREHNAYLIGFHEGRASGLSEATQAAAATVQAVEAAKEDGATAGGFDLNSLVADFQAKMKNEDEAWRSQQAEMQGVINERISKAMGQGDALPDLSRGPASKEYAELQMLLTESPLLIKPLLVKAKAMKQKLNEILETGLD